MPVQPIQGTELTSIQQILMILSISGGILGTALSIIISNRLFKLKGDIIDKMDIMKDELRKEMKENLVTKEYFNAKFETLQQSINMGIMMQKLHKNEQ